MACTRQRLLIRLARQFNHLDHSCGVDGPEHH